MGLPMDWLKWGLGLIRRPAASTLASPSRWLIESLSGGPSAAGVTINPVTAMMVPTVYTCVNVIGQTIAALPFHVHRRLENGGREPAEGHPLFPLLANQPNRWQTSFEFRMWVMQSVLLRGNAYAYIVRDGRGNVAELIPLEEGRVRVEWIDVGPGRMLSYQYHGDTETLMLLPREVFHVRGMPNHDGSKGVSVLSYHRDIVGEAKAAQTYGARQMANGSKLSGVIKVPHIIDSKVREEISKEWDSIYGSASNANKVAVLGAEADFKPVQMTLADAQYIESRKFTRSDLAAIFRVPPVFVGDHEHSTFSNNEQQDLHFVKHCITPQAVLIEQAAHRDLLTEREKDDFYVKFQMNALLRGDFATRVEGYGKLIEHGIFSPNEARALEDMPPREGGDVYLTPMNMNESGPDARPAPDDDGVTEPADPSENASAQIIPMPKAERETTVLNAALTDAATRVVNRDVRAIKTGAKALRNKRCPDKVRRAINGSADFFAKVMEPFIEGDLTALANAHTERLRAAVVDAASAADDAPKALVDLVEAWAPTEIEAIERTVTNAYH